MPSLETSQTEDKRFEQISLWDPKNTKAKFEFLAKRIDQRQFARLYQCGRERFLDKK